MSCLSFLSMTMAKSGYIKPPQKGHLRQNLEFNSKICLEFDEHGEFFPYGATQCDTVVAYKSVIAFGTLQFVTSDDAKLTFFDKVHDQVCRGVLGQRRTFISAHGPYRRL